MNRDQLGTPRVMTDGSKTVVWDAVFRPFGEVESLTGTATNDNRFQGQRLDDVAGFHYNYFRDYDPRLGRYIQSDPIGLAGGINTYAYAYSDPVGLVDPFGLQVAAAPGGAVPAIGPMTTIPGQKSDKEKADAAARELQKLWDGLPTIVDVIDFCRALAEVAHDRLFNEGHDENNQEQSGKGNLEGENARDGGNRTNTDLPGGRQAAEEKFKELTKGQSTTKHPMANGGEREVAPDGTQIRRNPDGTTRVDVPGRGPYGRETIHYD